MEHYAAFNCAGGRQRSFRVWHEPWQQAAAEVKFDDFSLPRESWPWFRDARFVGANYSHGLHDVGMGWPHRINVA